MPKQLYIPSKLEFSLLIQGGKKVQVKGTLTQIWKSLTFLSEHKKNVPRYHITTPFIFWDMHAGDMKNVSLQTYGKNGIC